MVEAEAKESPGQQGSEPMNEEDREMALQMRALSRFLKGVVHDLKGPLNTMTLNLELLTQRLNATAGVSTEDRTRHLRYVDVLKQETLRLSRGLQALQNQIVPTGSARQHLDLRELVSDLVSLISAQARHQKIELEAQMPEGNYLLSANRDQLKVALMGVVLGAFEAMPQGGRLGVRLAATEGRASIQVSQAAAGASPERVSEPGESTRSTGAGEGLRLANRAAEAHGGWFRVEAEPDGTTCYQFNLPLSV